MQLLVATERQHSQLKETHRLAAENGNQSVLDTLAERLTVCDEHTRMLESSLGVTR